MNKSLTIALPIHNGETRLRTTVLELLELASDLTDRFSVLIIDDGSTDHTYELAGELAVSYPQVGVRRHRQQLGLGPTMKWIERRVRADVVIVHDGISVVDAKQVRMLWDRHFNTQAARQTHYQLTGNLDAETMATLGGMRSLHESMAAAHQRLWGFQMLSPLRCDDAHEFEELDDAVEPEVGAQHLGQLAPSATQRTDKLDVVHRGGAGQIPLLPQPKFLSALTDFALGE